MTPRFKIWIILKMVMSFYETEKQGNKRYFKKVDELCFLTDFNTKEYTFF